MAKLTRKKAIEDSLDYWAVAEALLVPLRTRFEEMGKFMDEKGAVQAASAYTHCMDIIDTKLAEITGDNKWFDHTFRTKSPSEKEGRVE